MKAICYTDSEQETREVGRALASGLCPNGVLLLSGDLGCGKTVLTQGLAIGLGIPHREIQSPTFTLIREHQGSEGELIHVDLYRLEGEELESLGLWEILAGPGVKAVEWSERLPYTIAEATRASLRVTGPSHRREIEIIAVDSIRLFQKALGPLAALME